MRDRRRRPRWRRRSFCRDRTPPHRRAFPGAPSRLVGVTDKSSDPVARLPLLLLPVCLTNEFFLCAGRTPAECWFPICELVAPADGARCSGGWARHSPALALEA